MDPWSGLPLSTDGLSARYCELNHLGAWLRQPSNSLSSLAYLGVAAAVGLRRGRVSRVLVGAMCVSLVALGLGSASFHASITLPAQEVDMAATYAVVLALIVIGLYRLWPEIGLRYWVFALGGADALCYFGDFYRYGPWMLPLLIAVAVVVITCVAMRHAGGRTRDLLLAFAGMIVGGAAWILDDRKIACVPTRIFQWHALWHIATACGVYFAFAYFHEESVTA